MWNAWRLNVMNALNVCTPKIVIKNTHNAPWVDGEMRHIINKKRTAWHKARRLNTEESWAIFRSIRNETKSLFKSKHKSFINSLGDTCKSNPKRFWSFFHFKTKSRSSPEVIRNDETECSKPRDKATIFNRYFASFLTVICMAITVL